MRSGTAISAISAAQPIRFGTKPHAKFKLYCLPFAGGGASAFRLWNAALSEDVEAIALQLPGRESRLRDRPCQSVNEMVESALPVLAANADTPFAIFGHSMGALVAFELALALEESGVVAPSHLFVSARRAPDVPEHESPIHTLEDSEFIDALQKRYGGIPDAVLAEPELLALLLPALRADLRSIETYAAVEGRRTRCAIHVYGGADDARPRVSELSGWERASQQPLTTQVFDGGHFYLNDRRADLLKTIDAVIARSIGLAAA